MGELAPSVWSRTKWPGGAGQLRRREAASPRLQPEQPPGLRRARERAGANAGPRFCSSARRSPGPAVAASHRSFSGRPANARRSAAGKGKPGGCPKFGRGNPRPRVLGAKSALLSSPRRLQRFLTVAAGCVRGRGRGWGAQGGGLGARPVAGPAVLCFPAWLLDPPRGCSLMLPSAARTSRTRQNFSFSPRGMVAPGGKCAPASAEIRAARADRDPVALGSAP